MIWMSHYTSIDNVLPNNGFPILNILFMLNKLKEKRANKSQLKGSLSKHITTTAHST